MVKKKNKSTTHKYQVGDYVRIYSECANELLELDEPPEKIFGVITQIFGALFTKNASYAEYAIKIQGYPNVGVFYAYEHEFEKISE